MKEERERGGKNKTFECDFHSQRSCQRGGVDKRKIGRLNKWCNSWIEWWVSSVCFNVVLLNIHLMLSRTRTEWIRSCRKWRASSNGGGVGTGNGSFTSRPTVKPLKQYTHTHMYTRRKRERERKKEKIFKKKGKIKRRKTDATMLPFDESKAIECQHTHPITDWSIECIGFLSLLSLPCEIQWPTPTTPSKNKIIKTRIIESSSTIPKEIRSWFATKRKGWSSNRHDGEFHSKSSFSFVILH